MKGREVKENDGRRKRVRREGYHREKRVSGLSVLNERPMRASKSRRVLVLESDARRQAGR